MSTPDPTTPDAEGVSFGPPSRESRGRRAGRAAAWVAVGALGATALTGVALASTRSGGAGSTQVQAVGAAASTNPGAPDTDGMPGMGGPGMGGPGMGGMRHGGPGGPGMGGLGQGKDLLHGDLVVKDGTTTKNVLVQSGEVTAASTSSLTVKSSDGFVATWTLDSSTKIRAFVAKGKGATAADLKVGDTVMVLGAKTSATSGTATMVHVRPTDAQLKAMAKKFRQFGPRDGKGRPGMPIPVPTATAGASTTGA